MTSYIWDTGALIQFFAGNEQAIECMRDIRSSNAVMYVTDSILIELYYQTRKKFGEEAALLRTKSTREFCTYYQLTEADIHLAGKTKLNQNSLSLADSIIVATARSTKSTIVTTDRDFQKIRKIKSIKIDF